MLSRNDLLCTKLTSVFLPTRGSIAFKFICAELFLIAKQFSANITFQFPYEQDKGKIAGRNSAERYKNKLLHFYVAIENRQIYVEICLLFLIINSVKNYGCQ